MSKLLKMGLAAIAAANPIFNNLLICFLLIFLSSNFSFFVYLFLDANLSHRRRSSLLIRIFLSIKKTALLTKDD